MLLFSVFLIKQKMWTGPVRLTLNSVCSASFFSRNSVFLSQYFSRNSVFSHFQPSFSKPNGAKVVKQVCRVKNSGRKQVPNLNKRSESAKFKERLPLSKIEIKPRYSLGLPKGQENKLQKLSAKKLI